MENVLPDVSYNPIALANRTLRAVVMNIHSKTCDMFASEWISGTVKGFLTNCPNIKDIVVERLLARDVLTYCRIEE